MEWMKFKGVSVVSNRWITGTGVIPYNGGRVIVLTGTWDQEKSTHIKPETLCRFAAHIPGIGDLYEGDIMRRMAANGKDFRDHVVTYDNETMQWWAAGKGNYTALNMYIQMPFELVGNIHDPA